MPKSQRDASLVQFCKWAGMSAGVFWTTIYLLSEAAAELPNFVYVNF
jgi:hypothetical protein